MRLTFEQELRQAEYAAEWYKGNGWNTRFAVCKLPSEYMAVKLHVAKDHRYPIVTITV